MRLTAFSDFGLRALLVLASSDRASWSSAELASKLGVSRDHLIKVLQRLAAAGYVQTTRGAGGGVSLARSPQDIRIGDVLLWLEEGQPLAECFRQDGGHCLLTPFCALRSRLQRAQQAFYAEMNRSTLADCMTAPMRSFVELHVDAS